MEEDCKWLSWRGPGESFALLSLEAREVLNGLWLYIHHPRSGQELPDALTILESRVRGVMYPDQI